MRVAVLGAGYAGLTVARRLERSLPESAEITIVDESTDHLVQHELHRVIRYPELVDAITVPLENVLSWAEIREAKVTELDPEESVVTLDGAETMEYDFAAVCLGSETAFYGLSGVEAYATPLKSLEDARSIREDALDAAGGNAVVGGGGLSGIQTAGELAALSEADGLDLDVRLVEMADRIAPGFDATFAAAIRDELDARGVTVETGIAVESADEETVHLEDGRSLPADVFVWTGGIRGPESMGGERRATPRDLRISESTFVVGDAAALTDENGEAVPASAQTAVRQARVAASNIARLAGSSEPSTRPVTIPVDADDEDAETPAVGAQEAQESETGASAEMAETTEGEDREMQVYEPETAGWVVSVGDGAVAQVGPFVFSGEPAKAAKAAIGFGHLGSVGAIRQASELVAEELGWPTAHGLGIVDGLEGKPSDILPTDPASPGQFGEPFAMLSRFVGDALPSEQGIDLTGVTRQFDSSYPGSPMELLRRTLFDSPELDATDNGSDNKTVEIDVGSLEDDENDDSSETDGESAADEERHASDGEDGESHGSDGEDGESHGSDGEDGDEGDDSTEA